MRERSTRKGRRYAAIPNDAMRDNRISAEARGALALMMTYSDDWEFHRSHMMKLLNMGRDKFQRVMGELREFGYVELVMVRGEGGHLGGTTWVIRDDPFEPVTESLKSRSSAESLKNRQPVEPTAGETAPIRKPRLKKTKVEENQDLFSASSEHDDKFKEFWNVYPFRGGKKKGRKPARAEWERAVKKAPAEMIIKAAKEYRNDEQAKRGYAPDPERWLSKERWNDEIETGNCGRGSAPTNGQSALSAAFAGFGQPTDLGQHGGGYRPWDAARDVTPADERTDGGAAGYPRQLLPRDD